MYFHRGLTSQSRGIGRNLPHLGEVPNPDNMPTNPLPRSMVPQMPMPTNPVVPKPWCSELKKIQNNFCYPYGTQEIAISKTEAGHLTPDVVPVPAPVMPPNHILSCRHLIIRDFGVDWRHLTKGSVFERVTDDGSEVSSSLSMAQRYELVILAKKLQRPCPRS
jgi:hypothetical protein